MFPVPFLARQPFELLSAESPLLALSGMIRQITRLEGEGLVRGEPCPGERRGAYAILTEAGPYRLGEAHPLRLVHKFFPEHLAEEGLKTIAEYAGGSDIGTRA